MTLFIIGDFKTKEIQEKVEKHFASFKKFKLQRSTRPKEKAPAQPKISINKTEFKESILYLAWPTVSVKHKDVPALDILALILGQGDSSRLMKRLRLENPLTNYAGSSSYTLRDSGLFLVTMSLNAKNLKASLDALNEELHKVIAEPVLAEELIKAKVNMESDELYSMETVDRMASKLGTYQHYFGDCNYSKKFLAQIGKVTPQEIAKVAKKYLTPKNLIFALQTDGNEEECNSILKAWINKYSKEYAHYKPLSFKKLKGSKKIKISTVNLKNKTQVAEKVILDNGAKIIFYPSFDSQVVSLKCAFLGGVRAEDINKMGATEMLSRTWASASKNFSENQIYHQSDSMAGSVSSFGGRNTVGLNMTCLNGFSSQMFEIYLDLFLNPLFAEEQIEREKKVLAEYVKNRHDNPSQLVGMHFMKELFGNHPYGKDLYGEIEDINKINASTVRAHFKKMYNTNNLCLAIVGAIDKNQWIKKIEQMTKAVPQGKAFDETIKIKPLTENKTIRHTLQKEQTHIIFGYPALTLSDPKRYVLQVIQSILAGQGGRLFYELRDKASLAYTVSPMRMEGIDGGYFGAYIGCSPEKTDKAIEMMKIEFEKLQNQKVSAEELQRAQRYLIGRHDIDLQKTSAIASAILFEEVYGIPYSEVFRYAEHINKVTATEIKEMAQQIFSQKHVLSIVGP